MQYEPSKVNDDGYIGRDDVVLICTDEKKPAEGQEPVHDDLQMDATYLAINFAYLNEEQQKNFNLDTSEGKTLV